MTVHIMEATREIYKEAAHVTANAIVEMAKEGNLDRAYQEAKAELKFLRKTMIAIENYYGDTTGLDITDLECKLLDCYNSIYDSD